MQENYDRLIFPGRFQPLHIGHIKAIEYALSISKEIIIVVGSAQESYTIKNPLTAGERIEIIKNVLLKEFGEDYCKRIYIVPIMDIEMNKVWVQYLKMLLPEFDGVVSGNSLVLNLFRDMGLKAIMQPMFNRNLCSGTNIRNEIIEGRDDWKKCVPNYLYEILDKYHFVERLRSLSKSD
ncbi:cytidyltransferase-related enzyme [Caldisphaera lagunensis DSM 15908]|uniref:Nicotinamide-nucleotide adenylyltransferase n=1 Tax=Caldisphaera lagunensis (strain DSM 15908 / JCM 11604 / ANMR 0165 / IC-154) TaxID=1056495 RepID=L0AB93_CALLD|nr:nicotinamide-nucleotide adenylyltransferase [Caldisphaera lagunensis]AFZ71163.1 cytidyltransferase-related enzyme [Caldisphaera lagunensis DSM 15908]